MNNGFLQESPTSLPSSKDWAIWPNLLLFQSLKINSKIITWELTWPMGTHPLFWNESEYMPGMK